jgi:hypothetical protein
MAYPSSLETSSLQRMRGSPLSFRIRFPIFLPLIKGYTKAVHFFTRSIEGIFPSEKIKKNPASRGIATVVLEGAPGFEPGIRDLQSRALPLGYAPI